MSRNFELLQNLGREPKLFSSAPAAAPEEIERQAPKPFANVFGIAPEVDQLCHRLFAAGSEGIDPRVVTFCCVQPAVSEGLICAQTAMLLAARVNRSVCVFDSNPLSSSFNRFFGLSDQSGPAEAAPGDSFFGARARRIAGSNLTLIAAGAAMADSQLARWETAALGLRELRSQFDYILINGPTVPDRGQSAFLGRLSDGVVLILEANATRRDTAARVKREMEQANVPVLGAILNNRTFPIPDALYSKLF